MFSLWWEHSDPGVIYNLVKPCPHCWPDLVFLLLAFFFFFWRSLSVNWCLPAVTTLLDSCQHISIFQTAYYLCKHLLWVVVCCGFVFFSFWKHFCVWCLDRKTDHSKNGSKKFSSVSCLNHTGQLNRKVLKWISKWQKNIVSSELNILLLTTYHAAVFLSQIFLHFRNKISEIFPDESSSCMN